MSDGCARAKDEEMKKRVELERQLDACKREIENMEQTAKTWKESVQGERHFEEDA
jgi:hypothetical protein